MPNLSYIKILLSLAALISTISITYWINAYYDHILQYNKVKEKLGNIAGKNAQIIYMSSATKGGPELYKISSIDENGIVLENELQTIFIPPEKVINSEFVLPSNDYENIKWNYQKNLMAKSMDAMTDLMIDQLLPKMYDAMTKEFESNKETELTVAIKYKVLKQLKEEGLIKEVKKKD